MRGIAFGDSRCPSCGGEFKADLLILGQREFPLLLDEFPCPNCNAMIKASARYRAVADLKWAAFGYAIFFGLILVCALSFAAPDATIEFPGSDLLAMICLIVTGISASVAYIASALLHRTSRWEVAWMRRKCQSCGSLLTYEDAGSCPYCGEALPMSTVNEGTINQYTIEAEKAQITRSSEPVGTCLVCDLEMGSDEVLAVCPYCGNIFHRTHLVMWVHVRERCPACGQHLGRNEIKELSYRLQS